MSSNSSILTFNMSVKDRKKVVENPDSFQIMPSTRNYLTDAIIKSYPEGHNPRILIHMNYITKPFTDRAYELGSRERFSLEQYRRLADRLGTKNILIHLPESVSEYDLLFQGLEVIHDVYPEHTVHLEIPAFSRNLLQYFKMSRENASRVLEEYLNFVIQGMPEGQSFKIVFDTAHLFANGLTPDEMISLIKKFREHVEYVHLNGNINGMFTSDSHVPIFYLASKLGDVSGLCRYLAGEGVVCVAEVTKMGSALTGWQEFANQFGFTLSTNDMYSI